MGIYVHVYMYMCIFHYFNYYLPDFVTAICLGFIVGFLFMDICFNLTQHSENEDHGIRPITSWQIVGETVETVSDFILGGSRITADGDCSHEIK